MSTERVLDGSVTAHWALGDFGITACGLVATKMTDVVTSDDVHRLDCPACLQYAEREGKIFKCPHCDRFWIDMDERDLHIYSHE